MDVLIAVAIVARTAAPAKGLCTSNFELRSSNPPVMSDHVLPDQQLQLGATMTAALQRVQRRKTSSGGASQVEDCGPAQAAVPDGRECKLCGKSDDSPDAINSHEFWKWGYPAKGEPPKNQGLVCYYCIRTYNARYAVQGSCKQLIAKCGQDNEARSEFLALQAACIETFKQNNSRDVTVNWKRQETLKHKSSIETSWEEPDEEYWEISAYSTDFGDPLTNGKNHQVVERKNRLGQIETCVVVPQKKIYKLKRRRVDKAETSTVIDDGSFQLGGDHMQRVAEDLAATFSAGLPVATGVTLDALLSERNTLAQQSASAQAIGRSMASSSSAGPVIKVEMKVGRCQNMVSGAWVQSRGLEPQP